MGSLRKVLLNQNGQVGTMRMCQSFFIPRGVEEGVCLSRVCNALAVGDIAQKRCIATLQKE